jgi:formate dehydrogenase (NADP+) beta subunit
VYTKTPEVEAKRRDNLGKILSSHPHTCIVCPQREGCALKQCSSNVPEVEHCCIKFSTCELTKIAEYVGVKDDTPSYLPQGFPVLEDELLFNRN